MNSLALQKPNSYASITPAQAARELLRRRSARRQVLDFARYTMPEYSANWHHEVLCGYLDRFAKNEIKKLMVFMPPQTGKSQLVSRHLPAYILGREPDTKVIAASYAAELIQGMNRDVQRIIESNEYRKLFPETRLNENNIRTVAGSYLRNNDIFEIVGHKGAYRCAGVGGGLTGFRGDVAIIDDPYKDYREAVSPTVRNAVWEWYTSVFLSRTHVKTRILITLTRWHEDDLAARLLEREGDLWTVLKLPAICEEPDAPDEVRKAGEALWPERFPIELLNERRALNPHQFEALYQQNPTAREGSFFKVSQLDIVNAVPANLKIARAWDIAATSGSGSYTAGVKIGADSEGKFYVLDVTRGQWATDERDKTIKQTATLDGKEIKQRLPQDPGAAGKSQAAAFMRLLAGFSVKTARVSGDKETRADPVSSQVNAGNVKLLRDTSWNADFIEELRQFPQGKHDDQVDALSDAFDELTQSSGTSGRVNTDSRLNDNSRESRFKGLGR